MDSFVFEKHYRVKELAGLWGLSPKTVTRIFGNEAGVIRVANDALGKRKYATLAIPESVALRVHERLGNQPLENTSPGDRPLIRLNELSTGMPKGSRASLKLRVSQAAYAGKSTVAGASGYGRSSPTIRGTE